MSRKKRKVPLRKCVVTKQMLPKQELIRIVRNKQGEVTIDLTGKLNGRGAYLSKDLAVIEQAQESNILRSHLQVPIDDTIYTQLKEIVKE